MNLNINSMKYISKGNFLDNPTLHDVEISSTLYNR